MQAPTLLKQQLQEHLKIPNPKYQEALRAGRSVYRIPKILSNYKILPNNNLLVPRGTRKHILRLAKDYDEKVEVLDGRSFLGVHKDIDSSVIKYRPYQYNAVLNLTASGEEGILVAPPGSGKTVIGLSLVPLLSQPTLWLTHTHRLAQQALERIEFFLPNLEGDDIGYIGSGKWKLGSIITVALIQTLIRNREKLLEMANAHGMVILDEAHHCPAPTFSKVIGWLNPYYLYGLTATPYRRDGLEELMFQSIGEVNYVIELSDVSEHGSVMLPKVIYKSINSPTITDNNVARLLKRVISDENRNQILVADILQEAHAGNYCIVVSDRKAHCETLFELLSLGWEKTGIATGDYSKKYVDEQVKRFDSGEMTVLCTTFALLGEGFDVPFLNRAFITTPFRSEAKVEQLVGRIQRTAKNKHDAIVYDYVDVDIGVFKNQFFSNSGSCRYKVYERLGLEIEPG